MKESFFLSRTKVFNSSYQAVPKEAGCRCHETFQEISYCSARKNLRQPYDGEEKKNNSLKLKIRVGFHAREIDSKFLFKKSPFQ